MKFVLFAFVENENYSPAVMAQNKSENKLSITPSALGQSEWTDYNSY